MQRPHTDPFAAGFVVTGDATLDGIRVVRSVLGAISSLPIVAFREWQSRVAKRSRLSRVAEWLRREALKDFCNARVLVPRKALLTSNQTSIVLEIVNF